MKINVTRSSMPDYREYCEEIKDLWESHWLTNMGIKHNRLERALEEYLSVPHVSLYTNGHLALEAIWECLNFPRGSEVITTPFTFCSTVNAFVRKGLVPVFCDIDVNTYCIDANKIESLITEKTVAICPVHVYGNMCDVEKIESIARKHNLKVVYDAAHAFGVKYKGISSGFFGDFTMFSFHATKVFNTIEGGAICHKQDSLVTKLSELRDFGIHSSEEVLYIGGNAKMNEFQAAMGLCNLRHLDEEIEKRKKVVERYISRLKNVEGIKLLEKQPNVIPNYAYFPVLFSGYKKDRNRIFEELLSEGVCARKYFYPIVNSMESYKGFETADTSKTPVALFVSNHILTLPLYADLSLEEVDKICDIILK